MVRLPTVGGDSGNWGTILNEFLNQEHNPNGTHGTITPTDIKTKGPWADVRAFGAKGNGVTDDTVAIQAAISSLSTTGGIVYLPQGSYLISSSLTLGNYTKLIGAGKYATRILCNSATETVITATSKSLISISDFDIQFTVTRTGGSAIDFTSCQQFIIERMRLCAPYAGITMTTCGLSTIRDVLITTGTAGAWNRGVYINDCISLVLDNVVCIYGDYTPAQPCFLIDSDCDTIILIGCQAVSAGGGGDATGFIVQNVSGTGGGVPPRWIKFFGCLAEGKGAGTDWADAEYGFYITSGTSIQFFNCYVSTSKYGLRVSGGNGILWQGGEIFQNGQHGVYIDGGAHVQVIGAEIHNNSAQTANSYDGIIVGSDVSEFALLNNNIGSATNYGTSRTHRYDIRVTSGASDYYRIIGNRCKDGTTGKLSDAGTGTNKIVDHNLQA